MAVIQNIQMGVDSIEIGDFKTGRVKISFSPEESQNEAAAEAHIDRAARLREKAERLLNPAAAKPRTKQEQAGK